MTDDQYEGLKEFIHGYFRRMDAKLDDMGRRLDDLTIRLGQLEQGVVGLRRDITLLHEIVAGQSARMDAMDGRLARIERRLDLTDKADDLVARVEALEKAARA